FLGGLRLRIRALRYGEADSEFRERVLDDLINRVFKRFDVLCEHVGRGVLEMVDGLPNSTLHELYVRLEQFVAEARDPGQTSHILAGKLHKLGILIDRRQRLLRYRP